MIVSQFHGQLELSSESFLVHKLGRRGVGRKETSSRATLTSRIYMRAWFFARVLRESFKTVSKVYRACLFVKQLYRTVDTGSSSADTLHGFEIFLVRSSSVK